MKLIYKHGNLDPEHTIAYKLICPSCGCGFYATNHDFKWREKCIDGKAGITCPDCNVEILRSRHERIFRERLSWRISLHRR